MLYQRRGKRRSSEEAEPITVCVYVTIISSVDVLFIFNKEWVTQKVCFRRSRWKSVTWTNFFSLFPQNFLVDWAPWCCATAAFAPAELLLTRCTPGMDAALHSPSHTFPFFPLILFLCLGLCPNNQYNLGPFCCINTTLLIQRKPQPYWLQKQWDWILDPIETNDKTCIDFSGSRIRSLMLAICLCQRADPTRNERQQQICWQEIRSGPQNPKAELWWISFMLRF